MDPTIVQWARRQVGSCRFTIALESSAGRVLPAGESLGLGERHLSASARFDRAAVRLPAELVIGSPMFDDGDVVIAVMDGDELFAQG